VEVDNSGSFARAVLGIRVRLVEMTVVLKEGAVQKM
jgi:hypothetical protein